MLVTDGPNFGYFANARKTKLVVKEDKLEEARQIFEGTGISVTDGCRDLGAAIGCKNCV